MFESESKASEELKDLCKVRDIDGNCPAGLLSQSWVPGGLGWDPVPHTDLGLAAGLAVGLVLPLALL